MQSVDPGVQTEFTTHTSQAVRSPIAKLEIRWDGVSWVNESSRMVGNSGTTALNASGLLLSGSVDEAEVTLRNEGRRYSADATGGDTTIRSDIQGAAGMAGIRVRISHGFALAVGGDTYLRQFDGVIYKWSDRRDNVKLYLRGMEFVYMQVRASTPVQQNISPSDWIDYLAQYYLDLDSGDLVLDNSPFVMPWALMDDDGVMEEMHQTAAADGGWCRVDQWGNIHFERASHWVNTPHDASVWTFDAGKGRRLDVALQPDWLASSVVVEYSPRRINQSAVLYTLDAARTITAGTTSTFYVRLSHPAVGLFSLQDGDYWLMSSGGADMNADCNITLTPSAQRVKVEIQNTHSTMEAVLAWFQLRGIPLVGGPSQQVTASGGSWSLDYDRVRSIRGIPQLQTGAMATALAEFLADRCVNMQKIYTLTGAPGVPQLEIGDRVTVGDGAVVASGTEAFVIGIKWRWSKGYWQDITFLDAGSVWPSDTYYKIGSTALGSGDAWY